MGLDEARLGRDLLQVSENWIEPFDMANLQNATVLLGDPHKFAGLRRFIRHRLLDQQMLPLFEQTFGQIEVSRGWGDYAQRVAGGSSFARRCEWPDSISLSGLAAKTGIQVKDTGEMDSTVSR